MVRTFLIIAILCFFGIAGCKHVKEKDVSIEVERYSYEHLAYPETDVHIPDSLQKEFIEHFFLPWNLSPEELLNSLNTFPGKELSYLEKYLQDDAWYGENKKPHKKRHREAIVNNINTETFPNFSRKGIVIAHTDLRRIPTNRPGFDRYSKAGEGYPFDYFQETNLWVNTPLQLLHLSNDKQWCYAVSPYYKGWVAMHDIALVDTDFIAQWTTGTYGMPLSDAVFLKNNVSNYAVNAKMGMVLPCEELSENSNSVSVYYANADENQTAKLLLAQVSKNQLALDNYGFDKRNLTHLVAQLEGKPYGWGGNLENRDCSSMIRDLLATYKIWLPRDSKDQIEVGRQYELSGTLEEKMNIIKEKGIPFLTILRKKGHNMLYIGNNTNGEPLIFHAIWGLKTTYSNEQLAVFLDEYPIEGIHQDKDGMVKGRYIIGEAVITSVTAGLGNTGVTTPLLDEVYTMTNILED